MRTNFDDRFESRKFNWEQKYTNFMDRIKRNASSLIFNALSITIKAKKQAFINILKYTNIAQSSRSYRVNSSIHSSTNHHRSIKMNSTTNFTTDHLNLHFRPSIQSNIIRNPKLSSCITMIFILNKKILTLKSSILFNLSHKFISKRDT